MNNITGIRTMLPYSTVTPEVNITYIFQFCWFTRLQNRLYLWLEKVATSNGANIKKFKNRGEKWFFLVKLTCFFHKRCLRRRLMKRGVTHVWDTVFTLSIRISFVEKNVASVFVVIRTNFLFVASGNPS